MRRALHFHANELGRVSFPSFPSTFISLGETHCAPSPDILVKGLVLEIVQRERLEAGGEKGI